MQTFAVRLLALSLLGTALAIVPVVDDANAATTHNGKQLKKRVSHHAVARNSQARDPNANPFAAKYEDDFDRKNAGGGGGY